MINKQIGVSKTCLKIDVHCAAIASQIFPVTLVFNPLPHMQMFSSTNSAAIKNLSNMGYGQMCYNYLIE